MVVHIGNTLTKYVKTYRLNIHVEKLIEGIG